MKWRRSKERPANIPYRARITWALNHPRGPDSRPLVGPGVDIACGAVEPAVDRWESGAETPTVLQVELLASLTGYSAAWFYLPLQPAPESYTYVCTRADLAGVSSPRPTRYLS